MKTIIEMAREAGLERGGYWEFDLIRLEAFAALVRADEREECAKVCEKWTPTDVDGFCPAAAAIRARGQA